MYRSNLSKEKQLKFADTVTQGQNMTNNMLTMGSILERTPNMTVSPGFWGPRFSHGEAIGPAGADAATGQAADLAYYKKLRETYSHDEAIDIMGLDKTRVKRVVKGTGADRNTTTSTTN